MSPSNGPYLSYAVVCEKMLREADNVVSLIRIIDRVTVLTTVSNPAPLVAVTFAVGVKSGSYRGSTSLRVRIEPPSGTIWPDFTTSAELEGDEQGSGLALGLQFPAHEDGLYWFVVEISGEEVTRVPLRILKQEATPAEPHELG